MRTAVAPYVERDAAGLQPPDHDLVAAVRHGDDRAFEQLVKRYQRRIAAYVYGMVSDHGRAEDITQEIFMSALRRMRETEHPIAFKPWIYKIAKNACIDQFRRSRLTDEVSYDAEEGLGVADRGRLQERGPSPDAAMDQKQALHDLCGAFGGLSETHHRVLVLRELEGLSYREIGERLGMRQAAVESTLFRARRRLSQEYEELASGERCVRVQALIGSAAEGLLRGRDVNRFVRHVSHCQACRMQARAAGVDDALIARRPSRVKSLGAKIGGLLPFPAFLRSRRGDPESALTAAVGGGRAHELMVRLSAVGALPETVITGWSKATAAAVTLLVAGVGVGVGSQVIAPHGEVQRPAAAARVVAPGEKPAERAAAAGPGAGARPADDRSSPGATRSERRPDAGRPTSDRESTGNGAPAAAGEDAAARRPAGAAPASPRLPTPRAGTPTVKRPAVPALPKTPVPVGAKPKVEPPAVPALPKTPVPVGDAPKVEPPAVPSPPAVPVPVGGKPKVEPPAVPSPPAPTLPLSIVLGHAGQVTAPTPPVDPAAAGGDAAAGVGAGLESTVGGAPARLGG